VRWRPSLRDVQAGVQKPTTELPRDRPRPETVPITSDPPFPRREGRGLESAQRNSGGARRGRDDSRARTAFRLARAHLGAHGVARTHVRERRSSCAVRVEQRWWRRRRLSATLNRVAVVAPAEVREGGAGLRVRGRWGAAAGLRRGARRRAGPQWAKILGQKIPAKFWPQPLSSQSRTPLSHEAWSTSLTRRQSPSSSLSRPQLRQELQARQLRRARLQRWERRQAQELQLALQLQRAPEPQQALEQAHQRRTRAPLLSALGSPSCPSPQCRSPRSRMRPT